MKPLFFEVEGKLGLSTFSRWNAFQKRCLTAFFYNRTIDDSELAEILGEVIEELTINHKDSENYKNAEKIIEYLRNMFKSCIEGTLNILSASLARDYFERMESILSPN